jgi:hypothetical protein
MQVDGAARSCGAQVAARRVTPLEFEMQIDRLGYRNFSGRGTMETWAAHYRPAATSPTDR